MTEDTKNEKVKRRKIRKTDWEKVKDFLKKEFERRKGSQFRASHEQKWREVDRQISMEAMKKSCREAKKPPRRGTRLSSLANYPRLQKSSAPTL